MLRFGYVSFVTSVLPIERIVDEADVFRDAAIACVGLANNWARTNYAGLVAEFDNVFQARLAVACEAATILPDSVISAETAVRASEEIAAAWATIDNANQLWFHCLRALSIEKTLTKSPRGQFESSELFRSIQFPEKLTEQTRRMRAPLQLISAVADGAGPGIFTTEQALRTTTRIRAGVPDLGLLGKGRLDMTKPLSSQVVNDSGALYMSTTHSAASAITARTHGASSARRGQAL